jgi:hypothetical protein
MGVWFAMKPLRQAWRNFDQYRDFAESNRLQASGRGAKVTLYFNFT